MSMRNAFYNPSASKGPEKRPLSLGCHGKIKPFSVK
jgi:hypothetical protein